MKWKLSYCNLTLQECPYLSQQTTEYTHVHTNTHTQNEYVCVCLYVCVCMCVDRPSCQCWPSTKQWPEWHGAPVWGTLSTSTNRPPELYSLYLMYCAHFKGRESERERERHRERGREREQLFIIHRMESKAESCSVALSQNGVHICYTAGALCLLCCILKESWRQSVCLCGCMNYLSACPSQFKSWVCVNMCMALDLEMCLNARSCWLQKNK